MLTEILPFGTQWVLIHTQLLGNTKSKDSSLDNRKSLRQPGAQTRLIDKVHLLHETNTNLSGMGEVALFSNAQNQHRE